LHNNKSDTKKCEEGKSGREKRRKNQILMDKQFLMFAVNNDLTLFVSLEINDGSEKKTKETAAKVLGNDAFCGVNSVKMISNIFTIHEITS
jgi:hypothetical protein